MKDKYNSISSYMGGFLIVNDPDIRTEFKFQILKFEY